MSANYAKRGDQNRAAAAKDMTNLAATAYGKIVAKYGKFATIADLEEEAWGH
jgi:hypothetical protein